MANQVIITFHIINLLFLVSGVLMLVFAVVGKNMAEQEPSADKVIKRILYGRCPLDATIANAALIFLTFIIGTLSYLAPRNRLWLRLHSWLVLISGTFTLVLGLVIWHYTLRTRSNLGEVWADEDDAARSFLQERFSCCGYSDDTAPPFVGDATCPDAIAAAQLGACIGPVGAYANSFLDRWFTLAFAFVGLDAALLLATATVLRQRAELERYRYIDQKNGW